MFIHNASITAVITSSTTVDSEKLSHSTLSTAIPLAPFEFCVLEGKEANFGGRDSAALLKMAKAYLGCVFNKTKSALVQAKERATSTAFQWTSSERVGVQINHLSGSEG